MKTNNKLKPQIPYTHHAYQTKGGLFVLLAELDTPNKPVVKARRSQDAREMVQALMVWGDDGGAIDSTTTNEKNGEKIMSKGKNNKKRGKNKPAKTVKEKKQAKREKREEKERKENPKIGDL